MWLPAADGYSLALQGDKLLCKNAKGKVLTSLPKELRDSEQAEALVALRDWLATHRGECLATAETWLLRSLPVPRGVLAAVWPDPAWRAALENAVVAPIAADGSPDLLAAGILRAAQADKGLGIVDLDGETRWLQSETVLIPHPILLPELADFRALLGELGLSQGLPQLFRETFVRPADLPADESSWDAYADAEFEELRHALAQCTKPGYRVSGGSAVCKVLENGQPIEARYWIGDGDPEWETQTGELVWVDAQANGLHLGEVGPVAWSEGLRMAAAIYAARHVEGEEDKNA
ncbi:MAG: DUF4132 domain-containing protein [Deltaproteobacteria bacterium]|nr:DUF4132 domain-containing protein [Deltaproteobacteria bacterium]